MARPRRQHPGLNIITESPQGLEFMRQVHFYLGGGFDYRPLELLADGSHLFHLTGPNGEALLVTSKERAEGADWVHEWAFVADGHGAPMSLVLELTAHRWDPRLANDEEVLALSGARRRRVSDERRAASGAKRDRVRLSVTPRTRMPARCAGVARATLVEAKARHRIEPLLTLPSPNDILRMRPQDLEDVEHRVGHLLAGIVETVEVAPDGEFTFTYGSARVFVNVVPFQTSRSLVNVYAVTNRDIPATPDFFRFVAEKADEWVFGHMGIRHDGETAMVRFRHTLLGESLDEDTLRTALEAVALSADELDEQIRERFGGRLIAEHEPPDPDDRPTPGYL